MQDRFKFKIWNGTEMHYNDFVVTATGFIGKITEEFLGQCVFRQDDLKSDKECILMQCTGLKDRSGKLIYEGDILKDLCIDHICTVVWKKAEFALKSKYGSYIGFNTPEQEVIGNIYETPELLEANYAR